MPEKKMPGAKKGTFGRLIKLLFADYKWQFLIVCICLIVNGVSNVMPAVLLKNITDIIETGLSLGNGAWPVVRPQVIRLVAIMGTVLLLGLTAALVKGLTMATVTQGFLDKMRNRMFDKMQDLPIKYFDVNGHGDIMSHYTNDIDTLRQLISETVPQMVQSSVILLALVFVMLYYSINMMLIVFLGIILMVVITKTIGGRSARYFVKRQQSLGKLEAYVEELMNGQKVVKVFNHEEKSMEEFDVYNEKLFLDTQNAGRFGNIMGPMVMNVGNLLYVLVAITGGLMITEGLHNWSLGGLLNGTFGAVISVSVIVSFLNICKQFTGNVNNIAQQFSSVVMALAGAGRIFELMDEEPEKDDGYVTLVNAKRDENGELSECSEHTGLWAWKHPHGDGTLTYTELKGDVRLFNVDFAYEEGKPVLHDITLWAEPGQKIAFVGATGAGKTTITNLINRFYDIEDGKIRYDGININKIKKPDLRRSLGIVLQDVNLFTGTVMDNIRYGKLDATDEECIEAAKLANAHDFITRLPEGYDTMLSSNGSNLSQGQRQLISIARAAVADPPVMILDEATSSIDTRTEALVQRGMDSLMKGRTVFVIAHRLSTVRDSEAIMVLDHGRIIERGNHEDLVAQKGAYYQLYTGAFELE